jgi:hypothetical protein
MGGVKDLTLMKATQGDLEAWSALKALPEQERSLMVAIREANPDLAVEILMLLAGSGSGRDGRSPMPFRGAVYAAGRQLRTGERLGREFYWSEYTGPMDSLIGIRDLTTRNIGPSTYTGPFALTEDEAKARGLELTGDHADLAGKVYITVDADRRAAVATFTAELTAYKATLEALKLRAELLGQAVTADEVPPMPTMQYQPVVGYGLIWGEEIYAGVYKDPGNKKLGKHPKEKWGGRVELDLKNFSWADRLLYRCLRSGYKMIPGALRGAEPTPDEIDFDLGGKPVTREQWLTAQERERARLEKVAAVEGLPEAEKAAVVETMRSGAYGPDPVEGTTLGGIGIAMQPPPAGEVLPAIDTQVILNRLRAAVLAAENAPGGRTVPNQVQRAKVWQALTLLHTDMAELTLLVLAIVGTDDFATVGGAKAVYTWLKPVAAGDTLSLDIDAVQEAHALLAELIGAAEELPFSDKPEGADDGNTLDG